jgi:outer membrane receptor for monomeric catechols
MKGVRLIALGAILAAFAQPAAAGHAAHHRGKAGHALAHRSVQAGARYQNHSGYYVPYITDAAGKPVPIMQIPGSVTVVPREIIDDQQAISVCQALRNASGVFCR